MKTINEAVTRIVKDILDQYDDQQANLSSEIFRSQLADEVSRALRLNDLINKNRNVADLCELFGSEYPTRYR